MKKRIAYPLLVLFLFCLAVAGRARAELVRDIVTVQGTAPITVNGFGLVTGLANTGDKSKKGIEMLRKAMSAYGLDFDTSSFATGNIAVVSLKGQIDPFKRSGQKFSVTVTSTEDAKSLAGGELFVGDLYDAGGDLVARASGRVVTGAGILTSGVIHDGATVLVNFDEMDVINREGWIRLNLNKPDWSDASTIARQINQTPSLNPNLGESVMFAEAEASAPVAYAADMGQVIVIIPPQHRRSRDDVSRYLSGVLSVPVSINRPPTIQISKAKNSIVVTGEIRVNSATVSIQDKTVTIRPETPDAPASYTLQDDTPRSVVELDGPGTNADLQSLIDTLNAMGLTTEQVITIFEELVQVGAIRAELKIQ